MEYRQLRYFVAVAEELSFSRAALRLHVSQPPLSVQIKALEAEVGVSLFTRNRHSVALTAAGHLLLEHARKAIGEVTRGIDLARRTVRDEVGTIRIGFVDSVPMLETFSGLLSGFRASYPGVRYEMRHMSTGAQLEALSNDRLDVGFLRPMTSFHPGSTVLKMHPLWEDRLLLAIPSLSPLARGAGAIEVAALADYDFVGIAEEVGCGVRDQMMVLCHKAGFQPHVVQEARELRTVLSLVSAGMGLAILPAAYSGTGASRVVYRPLANRGTDSRLSLATPSRGGSVSLRNFIDYVGAAAENGLHTDSARLACES